jgi:hypothetical protein
VPAPPRWTVAPLPPYRYLPGRSAHPRTDPRGHGHGEPEPARERLDPAAWDRSDVYLRGIDLFNHGYFWESHEVFEALWHGAGRRGPEAAFFQGLVQLAASELKRCLGRDDAARGLAERALGRLAPLPSPWFGLDLHALAGEVEARIAGTRAEPIVLPLQR